MIRCKNCPNCDVVTGEDLCKRLKCTATKRGRTLTWSMCCVDGYGRPINVFQFFADFLEKHPTPSWCPKQAAEKALEGQRNPKEQYAK